MDYITLKEAAERWGVTIRRAQQYCKDGLIPGATKTGNIWMLPPGIQIPAQWQLRTGALPGIHKLSVRPYDISNGYLSFGDYSKITERYTISDEVNLPRATLRHDKNSGVLTAVLTSAEDGWTDIPDAMGMNYTIGDENISLFRCRVSQRIGSNIYTIYSCTILDNL